MGLFSKKKSKKKRPKKASTADDISSDASSEYDTSKVVWTDVVLTDLSIYIRNNNILFGICCSNKKHPFRPFRRCLVFLCYLSLLILFTAFITKQAFICKNTANPAVVPTEPNPTGEAAAEPPVPGTLDCSNQITAASVFFLILGLFILHQFAKMITKCGRIGKDNGSSNFIMQIIGKILSKFFIIPMMAMTVLFTIKGSLIFIRVGEPIIFWIPIISIVLALSLTCELFSDMIVFFRKRSAELKQNAIRGGAFDAHSDLRGSIKTRNIYVA